MHIKPVLIKLLQVQNKWVQDFKEHFSLYYNATGRNKTYESGVVQAIKVSELHFVSLWSSFPEVYILYDHVASCATSFNKCCLKYYTYLSCIQAMLTVGYLK
jgi:hypothetical protein